MIVNIFVSTPMAITRNLIFGTAYMIDVSAKEKAIDKRIVYFVTGFLIIAAKQHSDNIVTTGSHKSVTQVIQDLFMWTVSKSFPVDGALPASFSDTVTIFSASSFSRSIRHPFLRNGLISNDSRKSSPFCTSVKERSG